MGFLLRRCWSIESRQKAKLFEVGLDGSDGIIEVDSAEKIALLIFALYVVYENKSACDTMELGNLNFTYRYMIVCK